MSFAKKLSTALSHEADVWSEVEYEPGMVFDPSRTLERYIITIADDDRTLLDKLCHKLIAADVTCEVLRNPPGKLEIIVANRVSGTTRQHT